MAIKNFAKSSAETTRAPVVQRAVFKNCCMAAGQYDGSARNHYKR